MSRRGLAWLAVAAALVALVLLVTVRRIPEGQVGVLRDGASVRLLRPGVHLVNPIRDELERLPTGPFEVRGVVSVRTTDGFTARLPYSARLTLVPRRFASVTADPLGPTRTAQAAVEAGLEGSASVFAAAELLVQDHGTAARVALARALDTVGIRLESLDLGRPDPDLYLLLAEDALTRGDATGVDVVIDEALTSSPEDWRLLTARGLLRELEGDADGAEREYLRAVALRPGFEPALGRLFLALHASGQMIRLENLLLDGLAANPDSLKLHNWLALTYIPLQRFPEALDHLETARRQAPGDLATSTNLGGLYQRTGRPDDAVAVYREALEETPGDQALWHNLGLAELERGDLPAAREALERSLALGPASARLHLVLAEAYWRSGMETEATRHLLASHRLDPEQPGLRERLTEILGQSPD